MIRVQNIYHMLAYAFRELRSQGYRCLATEEFENAADLLAAILARGISLQLKQGLGRVYMERTEPLSKLRGKIEVTDSIKTRSVLRHQLVCSHDEFSVDTPMNRILKTTCALLQQADIDPERRRGIRRLLAYFADAGDVDLSLVDWRHMRFDRNQRTYRMLMGVCQLVARGLLQTQADGSTRLEDFLDEQHMCRLYERFVFEYYRQEHPELKVGAPYIPWALDDGESAMLPTMQTDIVLTRGSRTLIIDAKYYAHSVQYHFGKASIHSGNLYQIFTYVKNKEAGLARECAPHEVAGMLLYAGTDEEVQPASDYRMNGNLISVRSLDLNQPFDDIRSQLDEIAGAVYVPSKR